MSDFIDYAPLELRGLTPAGLLVRSRRPLEHLDGEVDACVGSKAREDDLKAHVGGEN